MVDSEEEAGYLAAILNAPAINELVRPYQSVGAFGPRHFDKYVWQAPIPRFDHTNPGHLRLVELAIQAEDIVRDVELDGTKSFQIARRVIRNKLVDVGIASALGMSVSDRINTIHPALVFVL